MKNPFSLILMTLLFNGSLATAGGLANDLQSWLGWKQDKRVETIDPALALKIKNRFLQPQPATINDFPVLQLLRQHLQQAPCAGSTFEETLQSWAESLHDVFGFKYSSEYADDAVQLKMGPQTSFYFYLGLLTLMRDVIEDEKLTESDFSLSKVARCWSETGCKVVQFNEDESIQREILDHRREYFEFLAYRFLEQNKRLDAWGDYYNGGRRVEYLSNYLDNWDIVRQALEDFHFRTGGKEQEFVIRVFNLLTEEESTDVSGSDRMSESESSLEGEIHTPLASTLRHRIPRSDS